MHMWMRNRITATNGHLQRTARLTSTAEKAEVSGSTFYQLHALSLSVTDRHLTHARARPLTLTHFDRTHTWNSRSRLQARACAAARIISSRTRVERVMMTPSPMPGKTYAVRHTPGRKLRPSASWRVSVLGRACRG